MASVFDVAQYILEKCGAISTWKLQKLCYYSQAWALAWSDEKPLFSEEFEAWANGPVCRDLYKEHAGYYMISSGMLEKGDSSILTPDEQDTIDVVLEAYGDKEPYWLREQTHSEAPWQLARKGIPDGERGDTVISKESMGAYYGAL